MSKVSGCVFFLVLAKLVFRRSLVAAEDPATNRSFFVLTTRGRSLLGRALFFNVNT
jgi:hypothetical protein